MGDFGGNAGLLSAWFDEQIGEWRFEYDTCSVGTQHIWWAVHVLDIVTLVFSLLYLTDVLGNVGFRLPRKEVNVAEQASHQASYLQVAGPDTGDWETSVEARRAKTKRKRKA